MRAISIFNQKGGVGKTTTVVNLAVGLKSQGSKVLVLDMDPQSNTTTGLGFDKYNVGASIYDLFYEKGMVGDLVDKKEESLEKDDKDQELLTKEGQERKIEEKSIDFSKYIKEGKSGVGLIPSESSLSGLEVELVSLDPLDRVRLLKKIVEGLKDQMDYDYLLIDCPPSLGLLSVNALVASDSIIIPIQTEYYALEGVSELMNTYSLVKESLNKDLEIEGVLLTMFDKKNKLSYEVVEEVKAYFKEKVFKVMIPRNVKLAEAPSYGKSILEYEAKSKGARAYRILASELMEAKTDGK
ncbi:MAG: ParA family protein [Anaerococcus sp.]|nr:ParA family protein [Anaerococcus sp.]